MSLSRCRQNLSIYCSLLLAALSTAVLNLFTSGRKLYKKQGMYSSIQNSEVAFCHYFMLYLNINFLHHIIEFKQMHTKMSSHSNKILHVQISSCQFVAIAFPEHVLCLYKSDRIIFQLNQLFTFTFISGDIHNPYLTIYSRPPQLKIFRGCNSSILIDHNRFTHHD